MQDFTKSMLSFSWAMSLFGVQQVANLFTARAPDRTSSKAREAFDCVTQATKEQLGETLQETFKTADKLQREMMDMLFGAFMSRDQKSGTAPDSVQDTAGCCGTGMPWGQGEKPQGAGGWGPMPDDTTAAAADGLGSTRPARQ